MTIQEILKYAIEILKQNNIDEAISKSKILLCFILDKPKEYLLINENQVLNEDIVKQYKNNIQKLSEGVPLQYITHTQEFMKLKFYVDENVLIPRADTEVLVEEIININNNINPKILDVCTGSGAIAISLAKYIENSNVIACDISSKAIKVATKNSKENNLDMEFIQSNMFENILQKDFDIIVSNPPYIETTSIESLNKDVKNEPYIALDGGKDGLDFYRIIAQNAYKFLKKSGILGLEIGYNQKESVIQILDNTKMYNNIYSKKDLGGNDRIIICVKK